MRNTSLLLAGLVLVGACSDQATAPQTLGPVAKVAASVGAVVDTGSEPVVSGQVILDSRARHGVSLEQYWPGAPRRRQVLGSANLYETSGKIAFSGDIDGQGTSGLRLDLPRVSKCQDEGGMLINYLPMPYQKHIIVSWKMHLGRTASGGGIGTVGSWSLANAGCPNNNQYQLAVLRDSVGMSAKNSLTYFWHGTGAQPAIDGPVYPRSALSGVQLGVTAGSTVTQTLELVASSAPGQADGRIVLWVNGKLALNVTANIGSQAFERFQLPGNYRGPMQDQSAYVSDVVVWSPAPPAPVLVASKMAISVPESLAVGAKQQITASFFDQNGAPMTVSPVVSYAVSNPAVAVMHGDTLVGVGAGLTTVTGTALGLSVTDTVRVPAPVVVVPAPVPTSGSFDTRSYGTDGSGIGGAVGAPMAFDVASRYTGDAAWRTQIVNYGQTPGNTLYAPFDPTKAGTGARGSAMYIDGVNPDLISWTQGAGPSGDPAFVATIKGMDLASNSPTPELGVDGKHVHSLWLWVRRRYEPGFSSYGNADDVNGGATWNATQGAGLKMGPYAAYGYFDTYHGVTYYGRAGLQTGNGTVNSTADYDMVNLPQGSPQPVAITDTHVGQLRTEWTDGLWRDYLVYVGNYVDSAGVIHTVAQAWERVLGQGGFVPISQKLDGVVGPQSSWTRPMFNEIMPIMLNANRSRLTDEHFAIWGWAAFDAEKTPNPFGIQGY